MKNIRDLSEIFQFLEVKLSIYIYLNRRVFVMVIIILERILPTRRELKPQPPDHQPHAHSDEPSYDDAVNQWHDVLS